MANSIKGEVAFKADGTDYTLVFDFNAIVAIEEDLDVKMDDLGEVMGAKASAFRKVFQIGLRRHHDVSVEEAGDIITAVGAGDAGQLVAKAFKAAFPDTEVGNSTARPSKSRKGRTG